MASGSYFTTPKGAAGYPHLFQPDEYKGSSKYKVSLTLTAEAAAPLLELIEEERLELGKKAKTSPGNPYKANDDGTLTFKFSSKMAPKIVDSAGNRIADEIRIGGGSIIQVKGTFKAYEGLGGGVSAYLNEVRLIKVVESSSDWGSDDEEEGYVASPSSNRKAPKAEERDEEEEADEDVNF
jgi:hypothetical protein